MKNQVTGIDDVSLLKNKLSSLVTSEPKIEKIYHIKVKDRFRVYFQWNKKQIFIDKKWDGSPIKNELDVQLVSATIRSDGYNPAKWKKDKSFNWIKHMTNG